MHQIETTIIADSSTGRLERTRNALDQVEAGKVVNGDEVMAWIASWGNDKETQPLK